MPSGNTSAGDSAVVRGVIWSRRPMASAARRKAVQHTIGFVISPPKSPCLPPGPLPTSPACWRTDLPDTRNSAVLDRMRGRGRVPCIFSPRTLAERHHACGLAGWPAVLAMFCETARIFIGRCGAQDAATTEVMPDAGQNIGQLGRAQSVVDELEDLRSGWLAQFIYDDHRGGTLPTRPLDVVADEVTANEWLAGNDPPTCRTRSKSHRTANGH